MNVGRGVSEVTLTQAQAHAYAHKYLYNDDRKNARTIYSLQKQTPKWQCMYTFNTAVINSSFFFCVLLKIRYDKTIIGINNKFGLLN